ncbi:MAG: CPn0927/CPn0928 family alpha/beta hydrolase fold protein [Parachlamydiaceae bacterium]
MSSMQAKLESFISSADYEQRARRELSQDRASGTAYEWNTKHKVLRIAETIFSIICFPVKVRRALHALGGTIMIPARQFDRQAITQLRSSFKLDDDIFYKRMTIKCDGRVIDVVLAAKKDTLKNGRWLIGSLGNEQCYEQTLPSSRIESSELTDLMHELNSNLLVFNYPGVGASPGRPSKRAAIKAYRAVLSLLEDPQGLGAKEIIGYGHSIGGGFQGEAVRQHRLKKGIKYVFVKSRTFDSTSSFAKMMGRLQWLLLHALGWNIKTYEGSKRLKAPEIIIQTVSPQDADPEKYVILKSNKRIADNDGIIPKEASLAHKLIQKKRFQNKVFIGVPEGHNERLRDISFVADRIEEVLENGVLSNA